jgi:hypothetical protein
MRDSARIIQFGLLGLFGLIGVGLLGLAIANANAASQIHERIAKLEAAGEPVSIADLGKNPPAAKDNAATYLDQAAEDCLAIQKQVSDVEERESLAREKAGKKLQSLPADDPVMIEIYRTALAAHPKAIELLTQAADCPRYHMNVNYQNDSPTGFIEELLTKVRTERAAMRTLNYRVRLLMAEGKPEEALDASLAMLRLANLFWQSPSLVGQLVALACRSVALEAAFSVLQSDLSSESRQRLEAELARQDIRGSYRESFRTERAVGLSHFDKEIPAGYIGLPHGKEDKLSYLELMHVLIENADRPFGDAQAKSERSAILDHAGPLTKLLAPAIQATNEAVTRNESQVRCLRVVNALLARDEGKATDAQLSDLGLPADATTDPFNDKPLNLKRTDEGWIIYSVGKNLKDDGGQLDEDLTDVGYGPVKLGH